MARKPKKKALYEVMSKTRLKPGHGRAVEPLHPEKSDKEVPVAAESATGVPEKTVQWPRRPRIVQLGGGRIEISITYEVAVALLLVFILLVLVVFRLGQTNARQAALSAAGLTTKKLETTGESPTTARPGGSRTHEAREVAKPADKADKGTTVEPKGNHRIVIVQYQIRAHLQPVQRYFADNGIATEIDKRGIWYFLVTKNSYSNPNKEGTDGYLAKQKIIEVGASYKAPKGYERFAPTPFSDAYGEKIR